MQDPIVIVAIARTPIGGFQGEFKNLTAVELGSAAIKASIERANINEKDVNEVLFGCVLPAGLGQAPARQAALGAGLPKSSTASTINKMCGSGMKTIMLAHDALLAGSSNIVVAGGMESMTNAPYLTAKARGGLRMGHSMLMDHMFLDGLEDAYDKGQLMGNFAEKCATDHAFTRQEQDDYAISSLDRAQKAIETGKFNDEIVTLENKDKRNPQIISDDEQPKLAKRDKIRKLRPAFTKDGTVTAANSSSISDGAASVVMMRASEAERRGLSPLAKIIAHSSHAAEPCDFPTAPIGSTKTLLENVNWQVSDVDLFEINEAFAVVPLAAMKELNIPHEKVNIHGGACALGHPVGASGARIVVTLINALAQNNLTKGVASICIGGGEATSLAIEMM